MIGDKLAYVALVVRDQEAPARVLGRDLGLVRTDVDAGQGTTIPVFSVGESALALVPAGHALVEGEERPGVHHVALAVADLGEGQAAAAKAGVAQAGAASRVGLGGRRTVALDASRLSGVRTLLTEPLGLPTGRSEAIERIDHLGIASADNRAAVAAWCGQLGRPLESQQTDMEVMIPVESFTSDRHGVIYHTRPPVPVGGLRVAFVTVGDTDLEFLQNFDPRQSGHVDHGAAGTTRQDQGAIAKFVSSRGAGLHHVALKTPDIDGVLARLDAAGVGLIDKTGRPGSRAGRIGFIHPRSMGGVLFHLDERP
ncbi:MAG: VOC family protein [Hyphomicrobiaceae bacterium]